MRNKLTYLEKAQSYFPALLIFVFCFAPKPSSIIIILWALNNILLWLFKRVRFEWNWLLTGIVSIYLMFVFGTFFTNHSEIAFGILGKKLSLLVFPIIFALQKRDSFQPKPFVVAFLAGLLLVIALGFINSLNVYLETHYFNGSFTGSVFSYIHHPTYLAIFLTISIFFFRLGVRLSWKGFSTKTLVLWVFFICMAQFFVFSFAGVLFQFLALGFFFLDFIRKKLSKAAVVGALVLIAISPFAAYFSVQRIQDEVNNTITDVKVYLSNPDEIYAQVKERPYGNNVRILMWTVSGQQFSEMPFGTGTGNFDEKMVARVQSKGLHEIAKMEYNSHNQYLQIAVELGIGGIITLFVMLWMVFRFGFKHRNEVLLWIGFSFVFNGLFESILQQQSGIVFFTLTICVAALSQGKSEIIHPKPTS